MKISYHNDAFNLRSVEAGAVQSQRLGGSFHSISFHQVKDNTFLAYNPVPKFLWAGLFVFYQRFPPQGFLFERFKRRPHSRQPFGREFRRFLRFVQDIAPALAFVFVLVVVVVVSGSLVKLPFVLEGLLLPALVAA